MNEQTKWIWLFLNAKGYRITQHEHYINVYNGSETILSYDRACGVIKLEVEEIEFVVMKAFMEVITCY